MISFHHYLLFRTWIEPETCLMLLFFLLETLAALYNIFVIFLCYFYVMLIIHFLKKLTFNFLGKEVDFLTCAGFIAICLN